MGQKFQTFSYNVRAPELQKKTLIDYLCWYSNQNQKVILLKDLENIVAAALSKIDNEFAYDIETNSADEEIENYLELSDGKKIITFFNSPQSTMSIEDQQFIITRFQQSNNIYDEIIH